MDQASASSAAGSAASAAGAVLAMSGAMTGQIVGSFTCRPDGKGYVLQLVQGVTSLIVHSNGAKVVSGSYQTLGKEFGGSPAGGLPGSLTVSGTRATVRGVSLPSLAGGAPLTLNGTVTCT